MEEVGVVDDGFSEVPAEILWSPKVNFSASKESGKLPLKACHTEKTDGGSWFELNKDIDVAVGSEIRAQDGAEQCETADSVTSTEFGY
jgi:hypothetical protein